MQRLEKGYTQSIQQMTGQYLQKQKPEKSSSTKSELSFQEILKTTTTKPELVQNLKFSKHANERLALRNINLSAEQMERLETGTTKAREKGIQESLVMVDDLAFIVNVNSNTVITAMDDSSSGIFTNIDGAVIG
ncbi:MAG: flagellar protein [Lachnospiraceae bacterium]|nr:flagellar protein [Lachnospiraceae bacterium]